MIENIMILAKYLNFLDIFSKELVAELPKYFEINEHLINLKSGK